MSLNSVVLQGRLCADPEVRYTQDQKVVARFRIAVNRFKRDEADFINCVSFGKSAELIEKYFKKGSEILVSGRIQTGSYKKDDGTTQYTTDVIVNEINFCGTKDSNAETSAPSQNTQDNSFLDIPDVVDDEVEGLPF